MARPKNDGKGRMGGRAKGTPNKVTSELKGWISEILENGKEQFITNMQSLEPKDYIRTYTHLLNYVIPKQAPITPDEILRKEKEMLQEMMLTMPDVFVNRLAEQLNKLNDKENESKVRE